MNRKYAELQRIDNNHKITNDSDYEFLYHLQNSLLLALKEQGRLNEIQYRHAEERLKQQRRSRSRKMHRSEAML